MAVQKEVWIPAIQENLYKGFELLRAVATDDSAFVNNKKVHVPNAGAPPPVMRGNTVYPVQATGRSDADIDYSLVNFEIGPVRLGWADALSLSYDKIASITNDLIGNLNEHMRDYVLSEWWTKNTSATVATTGSSTSSNWLGGSATGSLKDILGADVRSAAEILDRQKFPATDRWLLLDYKMFWQLLADISYNDARIEVVAGLSATIDNIFGFKVVQLPFVGAVNTSDVVQKPNSAGSFSFAASDRPFGLALHKSAVGFAFTEVRGFSSDEEPTYFGDILSASIYGGGKYRRSNANGVVAIIAKS